MLAAHTDPMVTLVWLGFLIMLACAAGAIAERILLRRDRKREEHARRQEWRNRINRYGYDA